MLAPLLPIFPMTRSSDEPVHPHGKTNVVDHSPSSVVDRWFNGITTELTPTKDNPSKGNVVTEVTRNSASDFTVVRSSQIGFTGVEIYMLSHWLAGTHPQEVRRPGAPIPEVNPQGLNRKPLK
jgi:hypothetical protein